MAEYASLTMLDVLRARAGSTGRTLNAAKERWLWPAVLNDVPVRILESTGSVWLRALPVRLVGVLPSGGKPLDPGDEDKEGNDGDVGERSRLFLTE